MDKSEFIQRVKQWQEKIGVGKEIIVDQKTEEQITFKISKPWQTFQFNVKDLFKFRTKQH